MAATPTPLPPDHDPDAPDPREDAGSGWGWAWWLLAVPLLPFLPLLAAGLEVFTLGTSHVEDFFRAVHLHDALSRLYDLIPWFD